MELKWFDGLLACSRPELLQRSLLHHQTRPDFSVIRQKVESLMRLICDSPSKGALYGKVTKGNLVGRGSRKAARVDLGNSIPNSRD